MSILLKYMSDFSGLLQKDKLTRLVRLQKSIDSQKLKFSISNDFHEFTFTEDQISSAAKKIFKEVESFTVSAYDEELFIKHLNKIECSEIETVLSSLHNNWNGISQEEVSEFHEVHLTEAEIKEIQVIYEKIITSLYANRLTKLCINVLTSAFSKLKLISVQAPIRKAAYEYFALIFSFKELSYFFTSLILSVFSILNIYSYERRFYRLIPVTCRTRK